MGGVTSTPVPDQRLSQRPCSNSAGAAIGPLWRTGESQLKVLVTLPVRFANGELALHEIIPHRRAGQAEPGSGISVHTIVVRGRSSTGRTYRAAKKGPATCEERRRFEAFPRNRAGLGRHQRQVAGSCRPPTCFVQQHGAPPHPDRTDPLGSHRGVWPPGPKD